MMIRALFSVALLLCCLAARPVLAGEVRADDRVARVWLSQVDANGKQIGLLYALECPSGGCQTSLPLHVGTIDLGYVVAVSFVEQGIYVAMQPQLGNPHQIIEYAQSFPGPIFVDLRHQARLKRTLRLMLFEPGDTGLSTTSGRYEPDAYLHVEYVPAARTPQS